MVAVKEEYDKAPMEEPGEKAPIITSEDLLLRVRTFLTAAKDGVVKFLLHSLVEVCSNPEMDADHCQLDDFKEDFMAYIRYKGDQANALMMEYGSSYKDYQKEKYQLRDDIEEFITNSEYLLRDSVTSDRAKVFIEAFKEYVKVLPQEEE